MEPTVIFVTVLLFACVLQALLRHVGPYVPLDEATPVGRRACQEGSREAAKLRELRWAYRHRGLLVSPPLAYAALSFLYETEVDWLVWPLGGTFVVLGVALRVWAQAHIRFRLRGHRHLATTGPYAIVRNPLYIANVLTCVGATIVSELLWLVPITVLWCMAVYSLVVRQEEARLLRKYGKAYHEYLSAVPRWVPRALSLTGLGRASGEHLRAAFLVEARGLLVLVPYVIKEAASTWLGR